LIVTDAALAVFEPVTVAIHLEDVDVVGRALVGLCPFHDDYYPSFAVYSGKGNFHCFGCGAHGDVIAFLQRVEHLSFRQALNVLEGLQSNGEARPQ
jgi:DNA primase